MNLLRSLQPVPRRYRIVAGVTVAALLGAAFATQSHAIFELLVAQSPRPERYPETGNRLRFWWAVAYFLGAFLLPTVLAYVVAGRGWRGWLGIVAYGVVRWQAAAMVTTGPEAAGLQTLAVVFLALYELLTLGVAASVDSDTVPDVNIESGRY